MAFFYVVNKTSQDLKYYINKYTVILKTGFLNKVDDTVITFDQLYEAFGVSIYQKINPTIEEITASYTSIQSKLASDSASGTNIVTFLPDALTSISTAITTALGITTTFASLLISSMENSLVKTTVEPYSTTIEITRPADTNPYVVGDIVNNASATSLVEVDLGTSYANRTLQITGGSILTDDSSKMKNFILYFFNTSDIDGSGGSIKADNTAFVPTYGERKTKRAGQPLEVNNQLTGDTAVRYASEVCRKIKLNTNGKFWIAPVISEALIPANGQKFTVMISGLVL